MARTHGSYAEYTAVAPAATMEPVARIPDAVADDQAAALPIPAVTALRTVDLLEVTAGQHVVVMGATGGVGGYAVQMARSRGAQHDTGNRIARIGRIRDGFSTPGVFLRTCSSCAATSAGSNVSCAKEVEALPGISGQATAIQLDSRAARPSTVMSGWTSSFSTRGTG